jgi:hypothetical protein
MIDASAYQDLLDALTKIFDAQEGKSDKKGSPKKASISIISIGKDKPAKIPAKKKVDEEEDDELV